MDEKLITVLKEYGLSEKEAKIYLVTLELGSAPASTIARRAGIKRVTAYALLQDLKTKQIAQSIDKGGVTHFQVVDPNTLLKKIEDKYTLLKEQLPALVALTDQYNNKPRIQYFEGEAGVKAMYEDLLTSTDTIYAFLGAQAMTPNLQKYLFEDFLPRRVASKVYAQVLLNPSDDNKKYASRDKNMLKESRIIDNNVFHIEWEINIYGPNKIAIALFSGDEMSAFIIHSPKLFRSFLSIFLTIWSTTPKKWNKK